VRLAANIPPVISKDYTPKGKYETVGSLKTGQKLLSHFHDPFSDASQMLRGQLLQRKQFLSSMIYSDSFHRLSRMRTYWLPLADTRSLCQTSLKASWLISLGIFAVSASKRDIKCARYPPVTDEQKTALYSWFPSRVPATGVAKIPKVLAEAESTYGKKAWASHGV
jgi:hypothetical protein